MNEKKYLRWYNKLGYGSGDLAGNIVYALLVNFVMIYLTDTVGMEAGIIGILMMISKFADGISDVIFGNMIDKTKSRMGKARPWMLWSYIGNAICLVLIFAIPVQLGSVAKYAYFFIFYTLFNAVFYTANNISYATLTALVTRNEGERVQMGSIRFMFSLATNLVVAFCTISSVDVLGGGAGGWKNIALIYALIGLIVNTIAVFSVKELPESELRDNSGIVDNDESVEKIGLIESLKLLINNKYAVMICIIYFSIYSMVGMGGISIYYMQYVLGDASLLGIFTAAQMIPPIIGLTFTPMLVSKFKGMYKVNLWGYVLTLVCKIPFIIGGYMCNLPIMLIATFGTEFFSSPLLGGINALIASSSEYTYNTKGKRVEGIMYSCSSLGNKIGTGIGSALSGILLSLGGYVANAAQQSASALSMLRFMYLWFPVIPIVIITICLYKMDVEKKLTEMNS